MSTKGNRDYRPEFHYAPPAGWINDPNGLCRDGDVWHLFAQHRPDAPEWGPMHWRHAVSRDLLRWEDRGIALYPDEKLGWVFSGSAVVDRGNTSGLGSGGDPMVLMYTHHGASEQQSVAFSDDRIHFTPYVGNPVIPNPGQKDFRDPKVIPNDVLGGWTAVIAAGDHCDFYASNDLIHWRKTGEFGAAENRMGGVFECPDLFPLAAPDGSTVWVLICSMALPHAFGGHRTQYFLGEFDGETFRETRPGARPRILDSGYDDYAAVTFDNADRRLLVGWANAWCYAPYIPTGDFCGIMTCARALSLADTDDGLRLAMAPVTPEFELAPADPAPTPDPPPPLYLPGAEGELPGEVFLVRVEAPAAFTLTLSNDGGEALSVTVSNEGNLVVDRLRAGRRGFSELYDAGLFSVMSAPRTRSGPATLEIWFDHMLAETFLDGGTVVNTSAVFPERPYQRATLLGEGKLWIGRPV